MSYEVALDERDRDALCGIFEFVRVLEGRVSHLEEAVLVKQKRPGRGETKAARTKRMHRGRDAMKRVRC